MHQFISIPLSSITYKMTFHQITLKENRCWFFRTFQWWVKNLFSILGDGEQKAPFKSIFSLTVTVRHQCHSQMKQSYRGRWSACFSLAHVSFFTPLRKLCVCARSTWRSAAFGSLPTHSERVQGREWDGARWGWWAGDQEGASWHKSCLTAGSNRLGMNHHHSHHQHGHFCCHN